MFNSAVFSLLTIRITTFRMPYLSMAFWIRPFSFQNLSNLCKISFDLFHESVEVPGNWNNYPSILFPLQGTVSEFQRRQIILKIIYTIMGSRWIHVWDLSLIPIVMIHYFQKTYLLRWECLKSTFRMIITENLTKNPLIKFQSLYLERWSKNV